MLFCFVRCGWDQVGTACHRFSILSPIFWARFWVGITADKSHLVLGMSSDETSETIFGDKNAFAWIWASRFSIKDLHLAHPGSWNKKYHFIIVLEFRIQLSRTFTKLEGRSADQNFARVRTIDSAARNTAGSSGSIGKVLPSAGVYAPLENVEFGIIADIVKNDIEISRISKICYSHFFCLPNVSSKRSCFFVTDTSMTPKKIQSEPRVFFRF